ncbi:MAG TPA: methyltransferase domain-containing protein [Polyangiaceae bacterium]|nr:methyltransferase domain-containing protein [Polyangiaceae bacterium]
MSLAEKLSPADAAILETFVVPRYLSRFGDLAVDMMVSGPEARILHVGCRTGYPDLKLYELVDNAEILGLDPSLAALELARHKATVRGDVAIEYRLGDGLPGELEPGIFTHALSLDPIIEDSERAELLSAMRWLLCSGGQALLAMPLRGSFQEVADLFREYALKYDEADFAAELDTSWGERPTLETLSDEFEAAGFEDVDVEVRLFTLAFDNGRAFLEDPASRLLILPEIRCWLGGGDLKRPLEYMRDAIDKYWSEGKFELTVQIGCASARCP